jgi:hypothetical protein
MMELPKHKRHATSLYGQRSHPFNSEFVLWRAVVDWPQSGPGSNFEGGLCAGSLLVVLSASGRGLRLGLIELALPRPAH